MVKGNLLLLGQASNLFLFVMDGKSTLYRKLLLCFPIYCRTHSLSLMGKGARKPISQCQLRLKNGDFAAAVYSENSQVYIGNIEFDDKDALISSMEHRDGRPLNARSILKWPTPRDEVWIARRGILCLIPEIVPTKITASRI